MNRNDLISTPWKMGTPYCRIVLVDQEFLVPKGYMILHYPITETLMLLVMFPGAANG